MDGMGIVHGLVAQFLFKKNKLKRRMPHVLWLVKHPPKKNTPPETRVNKVLLRETNG